MNSHSYEVRPRKDHRGGDLHLVETDTIIGGTGRYAGARGSYTIDRCLNAVTGETSGTISGTIVVREW